MDTDKVRNHIETLKKKHSILDKEIQEGYKNYINDIMLEKMKKEKLALKDEIEKYIRTLE